MSLTAQTIIQDAFELLQIYAPGEQAVAADLARGLSVLNDMLDNWSNLPLNCYYIVQNSFVLVPGQNQYTIGPGGNINTTRPVKVLDGPGAAYVQDFNGNNYNVAVVPLDQWNLYGNRSDEIVSDFPDTMWYDPQWPLGIVNVIPFPTIGYTFFFMSMQQFSDLTSLTSAFSLPPGYKRAVTTNLAISLAPYYKTAQLNPMIVAEALKTLGDIKRTNMRPNVALMDPELVSRAQISYNIYTDGYNRSSS
jgi:hypothetical protein